MKKGDNVIWFVKIPLRPKQMQPAIFIEYRGKKSAQIEFNCYYNDKPGTMKKTVRLQNLMAYDVKKSEAQEDL